MPRRMAILYWTIGIIVLPPVACALYLWFSPYYHVSEMLDLLQLNSFFDSFYFGILLIWMIGVAVIPWTNWLNRAMKRKPKERAQTKKDSRLP